jgi:putative sigma-54 modulation protein
MMIETIGRNVVVDDRLRAYVERKVARLKKFLEEPTEMRMTLSATRHRHAAELHVAHRGSVLQATEETDGNLRAAVDQVIDVTVEQARRSHEKLVDKRRREGRNGHRWPESVLEPASVRSGATPEVLGTADLTIKPMTIEEAALALDTSDYGFVVFRDARSDRVNVLYRRKDDNYGLIVPES